MRCPEDLLSLTIRDCPFLPKKATRSPEGGRRRGPRPGPALCGAALVGPCPCPCPCPCPRRCPLLAAAVPCLLCPSAIAAICVPAAGAAPTQPHCHRGAVRARPASASPHGGDAAAPPSRFGPAPWIIRAGSFRFRKWKLSFYFLQRVSSVLDASSRVPGAEADGLGQRSALEGFATL